MHKEEKNQEQIKKQCICLGMAALVLAAVLALEMVRKSGGERQTIRYDTDGGYQMTENGSDGEDRTITYGTDAEYRTIAYEPDCRYWMVEGSEGGAEDADGGQDRSGAGTAGGSPDLLMLVNKDTPLPAGYTVELHRLENGSCEVAEVMYDALSEMLTDGSEDGRQFVVASGYRDTERQQELLEEDIQAAMQEWGLTWEQAYILETRETMPPRYSEHETGLAADIVALDYQLLDEGQELTEENQWLQENCSKYGFILRYPKGKEEITGIDYESWHFRYVGKEAAQEITRRGITLEEYLEEPK